MYKEAIRRAILHGDRCTGQYDLIVSSDGDAEVVWVEENRFWDPWQEGDDLFAVPSLVPDGSGRECEDAYSMLSSIITNRGAELATMGFIGGDGLAYVQEFATTHDLSVVEVVEQYFTDDWQVNRQEAVDWLLSEFLEALNGSDNDTGRGFYSPYEDDGRPNSPKFDYVYDK